MNQLILNYLTQPHTCALHKVHMEGHYSGLLCPAVCLPELQTGPESTTYPFPRLLTGNPDSFTRDVAELVYDMQYIDLELI